MSVAPLVRPDLMGPEPSHRMPMVGTEPWFEENINQSTRNALLGTEQPFSDRFAWYQAKVCLADADRQVWVAFPLMTWHLRSSGFRDSAFGGVVVGFVRTARFSSGFKRVR